MRSYMSSGLGRAHQAGCIDGAAAQAAAMLLLAKQPLLFSLRQPPTIGVYFVPLLTPACYCPLQLRHNLHPALPPDLLPERWLHTRMQHTATSAGRRIGGKHGQMCSSRSPSSEQ